jgi:hypothetical protein
MKARAVHLEGELKLKDDRHAADQVRSSLALRGPQPACPCEWTRG